MRELQEVKIPLARKEAENLRQSNRAMGHGTEIDLWNVQKGRRTSNSRTQCVDSGIDGYYGKSLSVAVQLHHSVITKPLYFAEIVVSNSIVKQMLEH